MESFAGEAATTSTGSPGTNSPGPEGARHAPPPPPDPGACVAHGTAAGTAAGGKVNSESAGNWSPGAGSVPVSCGVRAGVLPQAQAFSPTSLSCVCLCTSRAEQASQANCRFGLEAAGSGPFSLRGVAAAV